MTMDTGPKTKPQRPQPAPMAKDRQVRDALERVVQRHRELFRRLKAR